MATIPSRIESRMTSEIKRFQSILASAKARDISEADTVRITTEMLADILGYDKFSEITAEHAIRGTFCDLATQLDSVVQLLIEVKAIGLDLKDAHVKQAVDYAANKGIEWVVLTNAIVWKVYKVTFGKPIDHELVYEIDFLAFDSKSQLELLYVITREGWVKNLLQELHEQRQALSKFAIAAIVMSEPIVNGIRRELRQLCPNVKIQSEQIYQVLSTEILKREVVEGEKAEEARKKITRLLNRRTRADKSSDQEQTSTCSSEIAPSTTLPASPSIPIAPTAPS